MMVGIIDVLQGFRDWEHEELCLKLCLKVIWLYVRVLLVMGMIYIVAQVWAERRFLWDNL